jgi:hypothetical protein
VENGGAEPTKNDEAYLPTSGVSAGRQPLGTARKLAAMRRLATVGGLVVLAYVAMAGQTLFAGAPITAEFAQSLYGRVGPLREPDGCRLTRFDTSRFQITIGLVTSTGAQHAFDLGTMPAPAASSRTAGDWWLAVPAALGRDCPTTVSAIERMLAETSAPIGPWHVGGVPVSASSHYSLLAGSFLLLLLGTVHVLSRERKVRAAPTSAVVALLLVCAVALALRLGLSPRTFLHEYYHIAETVPAYFSGEQAPGYGRTGPALFRLVGRTLGDGEDVRIIFLTNAVISSLAVPAAAMLVLAVFQSWPQAICAALLLAVLPQHLRFSAAEDLFVQAITFGLWSLALFASYQRTRRQEDALLGALAASLATQSRPEMIFFPLVVGAFLLCSEPRSWRTLFARPVLVAAVVFAVLLVPHALDVMGAMREARAPSPGFPPVQRYFESLVVLDPRTTPIIYPLMIVAGAAWSAMHRPGWLLWIVAVYVGFTVFALSIFDNPPWLFRAQNLPTSYLVLLGAGAVPLWTAAWRSRRRLGAIVGTALLVLSAVVVVARWRGFVGELKDQQLEWAFLERHVSHLPTQGTLITAVEAGGKNLDAFPEFLLTHSGRRYSLVDVRKAAKGTAAWPQPTGELLFYQGMFCYFAFEDEPSPDPMTPVCRAVHERYAAEPLIVEDLHTEGYSSLRYAQGGRGVYRIGFYRLTPRM